MYTHKKLKNQTIENIIREFNLIKYKIYRTHTHSTQHLEPMTNELIHTIKNVFYQNNIQCEYLIKYILEFVRYEKLNDQTISEVIRKYHLADKQSNGPEPNPMLNSKQYYLNMDGLNGGMCLG